MFGFGSIGGWELLFLVVLALMLFGPRRIPEIARTFGKTVGQLRRASHEFRTGIEREVEAERLKDAGDALRSLRDEVGSVQRQALDVVRRTTAPPPEGDTSAPPPATAAPAPTSPDRPRSDDGPPTSPEPAKENPRRDERSGDE